MKIRATLFRHSQYFLLGIHLFSVERYMPDFGPAIEVLCQGSGEPLAGVGRVKGDDGFGVERLFRGPLLPFMEDLWDRELDLQ